MLGGYNIAPLIDLLDDAAVGAPSSRRAQKKDAADVRRGFHDVNKADAGNANAKAVLQSWADGRVVHQPPGSAEEHHRHRLQGHRARPTPTTSRRAGRLEPAGHPAPRLAMLKNPRPGITPRGRRSAGRSSSSRELRRGHLVAYVGDVVGTAPAAKSATNPCCGSPARTSPSCPNKRFGGVCSGQQDCADLLQHDGRRRCAADRASTRQPRWRWATPSNCAYEGKGAQGRQGHRRVQGQERRAVRRGARRRPHQSADHRPRPTAKAREAPACRRRPCSACPRPGWDTGKGYTLAQKMVGRACGLPGEGHPPLAPTTSRA